MDFTITLSGAENKALEWAAYDNLDWIQNAASNRARVATEEIAKIYVDYKMERNEAISATSKADMVLAAYSEGIIQRARTITDNQPTTDSTTTSEE